MKAILKTVIAVLLVTSFLMAPQVAWAQTEAGFLDQLGPQHRDPESIFSGSAWYCIDYTVEYDPILEAWYPVQVLVTGPWSSQPNCNAG